MNTHSSTFNEIVFPNGVLKAEIFAPAEGLISWITTYILWLSFLTTYI